jgi:hypothetical protein
MAICKFSDFFLSSSNSTTIAVKERLGDDKPVIEFITNAKNGRQWKDGSKSNEAIALRKAIPFVQKDVKCQEGKYLDIHTEILCACFQRTKHRPQLHQLRHLI